jgi:hypothetical protein
MSSRHHQSLEPGQDSFLDIVANLVGILIILIAVIGVQTKQAMMVEGPDDGETDATEELRQEMEERTVAAEQMLASFQLEEQSIESDINQKLNALRRQNLEVKFRETERDRLNYVVTAVSREIAERKSKLTQKQQEAVQLQQNLAMAQDEAKQLDRMLYDAEQQKQSSVVLRHLPTPMAKTVFGKELHFRLHNGRIAYVPFDEMVAMLKEDAQRQVWKLKDAAGIEEQLGPVKGFRMNYRLVRKEFTTPGQFGAVSQTGVELDQFQLHPISDELGEPVRTALKRGSQFQDILAAHRPQSTTITIWVYPESFGMFHDMKHALYDLGYLTAARPMPNGQPIGGSPRGTRSAAQ